MSAAGSRPETGNLLEVENLQVGFTTPGGLVTAVDDVSFRVRPGAAVAIVGESGSGKSVTAQAVLGILPRNGRVLSGAIRFADPAGGGTIDLAGLARDGNAFQAIRGKHIAMIFQEPMTSLSPLHTIGDQISEALFLHSDVGRAKGRAETVEMLRLVGFDEPARAFDTYPFELSGGLRQRAMIAMALICRPALLIADEPSTALDVTIQAQILKLIADLRSRLGMAVLLITHDLGVVANVADEVIVMYRGRVMESGPSDAVFGAPRHPYLRGLLGAVPHFDMRPGERLKPLREIAHAPGHLLAPRPPAADDGRPLLEVVGLVKRFTQRRGRGPFGIGKSEAITAVDHVSFSIPRGGCVGLVGESGCGKSTVSKIILRGVEPDAGRVLYRDGEAVDLLGLDRRGMFPYRRKIQYVFQDPQSSLNPRMTVFDILCEPLIIHGLGDAAYRRQMVVELMQRVGLDPRYLSRHPHTFSGGQRQRIGIARALALRPELIILDEPVSALDVSVQAQILNLLKALQAELGLTYLFISHNLAVVDYMAERILVMCAGRIVEEAPRHLLFRRPVHPYTQALLAAVPFPDPDRRLDFGKLMDGRASLPAAWPPPFDDPGDTPLPMIDIGHGHLVRARDHPRGLTAAVR
jgi:peptide/nickel transport system ATP-binding protein